MRFMKGETLLLSLTFSQKICIARKLTHPKPNSAHRESTNWSFSACFASAYCSFNSFNCLDSADELDCSWPSSWSSSSSASGSAEKLDGNLASEERLNRPEDEDDDDGWSWSVGDDSFRLDECGGEFRSGEEADALSWLLLNWPTPTRPNTLRNA